MKTHRLLLLRFTVALGLGLGLEMNGSTAWAAYSIDECYQAALKRSEAIATQTELVNQAEERYRQATGSILPSLNANASYFIQQTPSGAFNSSFSPNQQPLVRLTANQPIFRGFREFAGLNQAERLREAQSHTKQSAMILLYNDVAQNYYTILSLEKDLRNVGTELEYYGKRIKELNERRRIGRSRSSEVWTVQSAESSLKAQSEQLRGQLKANREVFAFLTGLPQESELQDIRSGDSQNIQLGNLDDYLSQVERRPDVQANHSQVKASESAVSVARGAHLPSVDFLGNYYLVRRGFLRDVHWDVQFALTFPIFAGGVIQSRVHEAESQQRQADFGLSRARRLAEQEIRSLYETVQSDQKQLNSLIDATQLAEKSYLEQSREYRLGLVTNIDVLQALTAFQESQRALDRARYATQLDFSKLEAAIAKRPHLSGESLP